MTGATTEIGSEGRVERKVELYRAIAYKEALDELDQEGVIRAVIFYQTRLRGKNPEVVKTYGKRILPPLSLRNLASRIHYNFSRKRKIKYAATSLFIIAQGEEEIRRKCLEDDIIA